MTIMRVRPLCSVTAQTSPLQYRMGLQALKRSSPPDGLRLLQAKSEQIRLAGRRVRF